MFEDYAACVMQDYRLKVIAGKLSLKLQHPTAAKLREACIEVCDSRYKRKDEKVLADFFKNQESGDAYLAAIKDADADQFKPLLNYINRRTSRTDERNIELLAWLIDFEPRPYQREHIYQLLPELPPQIIEITDQLEARENKFTKSKRKIAAIAQLTVACALLIVSGLFWYLRPTAQPDGKCMYWSKDHYERGNCDIKPVDENTLVIAFDTTRWQNFKKIETPDTLSAASIGKVWYIKLHGAIEYYTAPGLHPLYPDRRLLPLTAHILDTYNRTTNQ